LKSDWNAFKKTMPRVGWNKLLWHRQVIPIHAYCVWKVLHKKLCTQDMLKRKGIHLALICVLCRKAEENVDHLFFKCPFAQWLWSLCSLKLKVKLQACKTVEALAVQFKKLINGSGQICAIAKLAFSAVI
jgi:hypothetical protein